jgi:HAD superfamily hydrolase (TIGR01509 family)
MNVVFDLGGVVFNWQPIVLLQQVLPQHAANEAAARQLAARLFQGFAPDADWALFDLGQIEPDALARRIATRTGLAVAEVAAVISAIPPHLVPNQTTVALMQDLRAAGHRLYYLSNMPASYADGLELRLALFALFTDGVFSARVHQIKPNADIFATATRRFGVDAAHTVFIDDVQHNIEAAQRHGWHGVLFQSAEQVRAELAQRWPS